MGNTHKRKVLRPGSQLHLVLATIEEIPSTTFEVAQHLGMELSRVKASIEHANAMGYVTKSRYSPPDESCNRILYLYSPSPLGLDVLRSTHERYGDMGQPVPTELRKPPKQPRAVCQAKYSQAGTGIYLLHS